MKIDKAFDKECDANETIDKQVDAHIGELIDTVTMCEEQSKILLSRKVNEFDKLCDKYRNL